MRSLAAICLVSSALLAAPDMLPAQNAIEPALMTTLEDGNLAFLVQDPGFGLPTPAQFGFTLPGDARPHGASFARGGTEVVIADFAQPRLYRASIAVPAAVTTVAIAGRTNASGTLAADPNGRYVLSVGQNATTGGGESVVVDLAATPPVSTPITPTLTVPGFVTAAIDFAPDGRAFVCHTTGVSVLSPPYTSVDFTMPFPAIAQSPSMCRLTRDGARLFVSRMLSETVPTVNAIRTTPAPYSASSVFTEMPAPAGVQGLGPMAVSPDGQALIVAQQFLFPQAPNPPKARVFVLRAPFGGQTAYEELVLPAAVAGLNCSVGGSPADCPGFEHVEVSADGRLAILTGNSSSELAGAPGNVSALFVSDPFDAATRSLTAVPVGLSVGTPGRGAGAVRFRPMTVFRSGLER